MSDAKVLADEMLDGQGRGFPWPLCLSELIGTALLVLGGLSCVIVMNGDGSPIPKLLPDEGVRRAITGSCLARRAPSSRFRQLEGSAERISILLLASDSGWEED